MAIFCLDRDTDTFVKIENYDKSIFPHIVCVECKAPMHKHEGPTCTYFQHNPSTSHQRKCAQNMSEYHAYIQLLYKKSGAEIEQKVEGNHRADIVVKPQWHPKIPQNKEESMIIEVQCTSLTREKITSREQNNVVWLFKGDMGKVGRVYTYPLKVAGVLAEKKYVCTTKISYWFIPNNPVYLIVDGYIYRIVKKIAKTYFVMEQTDHLGSDESCFDFGRFPEKDRFYQELVEVSKINKNTMSFDTNAPLAELFLCERCQKEGVIITVKFGTGEHFCDCKKEKHRKLVNTPCDRDPIDERPLEKDFSILERKKKASVQKSLWEKVKVHELKTACELKGLKVSGKKSELIYRLENPDDKTGWTREKIKKNRAEVYRKEEVRKFEEFRRKEELRKNEEALKLEEARRKEELRKNEEKRRWESMPIEELRDACKGKGLKDQGRKATLVDRLCNPTILENQADANLSPTPSEKKRFESLRR
jgi:hypothetical protein